MLPIRVSLFFLVFTEILFFAGPLVFHAKDPLILVLFLIIVNTCLFLGYKKEIKNHVFHPSCLTPDSNRALVFTRIILIFSVLVKPLSMYVAWQLHSFSFSAFVEKFLLGLYSPKDVYEDFNNLTGGTFLSAILVLMTPLTYMALPCGVYNIKNLSFPYKLLVVVLVLLEIITCLGLGIRKKLLDVILIVGFSYLASRGTKPFRLFKNIGSTLALVVAVVGLLYYFTYSSLSRSGTEDITAFFTGSDIRKVYLKHTSPDFYMSLANVQFYLSHAYDNLATALSQFLSLDKELIFTFGFGNNSFTLSILNKYLGIDLTPFTYQYVLNTKYGLNIGQQWMTIYPWIANDVTFFGVPFVIYWIGKLFARFWMDCLYQTNFYAIPLLSFMAITVFYSFANNQGLSYSFLPAIVIGFLYHRVKTTNKV